MVLKKFSVTGANGMLGKYFVEELQKQGAQVAAITRAQLDLSNLTDHESLNAVFKDSDVIIHCAAQVPTPGHPLDLATLQSANVRATEIIGKWAKNNARQLVFISGSTVYADSNAAHISETAPKVDLPFQDYGSSKWAAEVALENLHLKNLLVLRPSSLYGHHASSQRLISKWLKIASENGVIDLSPPFESGVNLVHCLDVVKATLQAIELEKVGAFNVAGPTMCSFEDIAQRCIQVTGKGQIKHLPSEAINIPVKNRYDLDCSKAKKAFNFAPQMGLVEGLNEVLEKWRLNGSVNS